MLSVCLDRAKINETTQDTQMAACAFLEYMSNKLRDFGTSADLPFIFVQLNLDGSLFLVAGCTHKLRIYFP